jgi:hypothetical protein
VGCVDAARGQWLDAEAPTAPKACGDGANVFGTERTARSSPGAATAASAPGSTTRCCPRARLAPPALGPLGGGSRRASASCTCCRARTGTLLNRLPPTAPPIGRAPVAAGNTAEVVGTQRRPCTGSSRSKDRP